MSFTTVKLLFNDHMRIIWRWIFSVRKCLSNWPVYLSRERWFLRHYLSLSHLSDVKAFVDVYWCHPRVLKLRGRKCPGKVNSSFFLKRRLMLHYHRIAIYIAFSGWVTRGCTWKVVFLLIRKKKCACFLPFSLSSPCPFFFLDFKFSFRNL